MSHLPAAGPIILTIPGVTDTLVAAGTTGTAVRYIWPQSYVITGLMLSLRSASLAQLALTTLRMVDDDAGELVNDGQGIEEFAPALALVGGPLTLFGNRKDRWQSFRYVVRGGERWTFQITNGNGADVIPWLGFRVETGDQ